MLNKQEDLDLVDQDDDEDMNFCKKKSNAFG